MKTFKYLALIFITSCGGVMNGHLGGGDFGSVSAAQPNQESDDVVDSSSKFKRDGSGSFWETDLGFKDRDGNVIGSGDVRLTLRNCSTNQIYFSGVFDYGASLDFEDPIYGESGSLDWKSDVQPFYSAPSILADGQSLQFDKEAWANHVGLLNHSVKSPRVRAVALCSDFRVRTDGYFSKVSTTRYDVAYNYSADNDIPLQVASRQLIHGGPFNVSSDIELDESQPSNSCQYLRLNSDERGKINHVIGVERVNGWSSVDVRGSEYWRSIGEFFGGDYRGVRGNDNEELYGKYCEHYVDVFYIYAPTLDAGIKSLRIADEDDKSRYVDVRLGVYQSF